AVAQFFALGFIPAPRTHIRGVNKLGAGETVTLTSDGSLRRARYWQPTTPEGPTDLRSTAELVDEVSARLKESLRRRLRSDVPVGAFLSGGIDSSLIVAAVRELEPSRPLSTFCATFSDENLDEARHAREVAKAVGSDHHEVHIEGAELTALFDD